jgi:hypothetical protein
MQHNSAHSESRAGLASGHSRPAAPLAWDHQLQQRFLVAVIKSGGPAEATPAVVRFYAIYQAAGVEQLVSRRIMQGAARHTRKTSALKN